MNHLLKSLTLPQRRAITCLGILVWLIFYVLAVVALGEFLHGGRLTSFIFYALAGTLWGVPIIPLISWSENYKGKPKR
ncbi:DUF2842 domain-containing protein [Asticcacaulis sp.]|uniref:DUF2842 domain-containing protein n=1 Tax=Asticcacaulis sp. TaxID=1872648 RepID=UPI002CE7AB23|nr:DUF2842 domain-containing protein [Asticcacaulis sp.]HTM82447.1 DUF2842 domain-containing protein [Asticcacaulis sp.]